MEISWFGHSCFNIVDSGGRSIVTDPPDSSVGYRLPRLKADVVLISHDHFDHNNKAQIVGNPVVLTRPGRHTVAGEEFVGISTYHDEEGGRLRGPNTVFRFQADGIRICHLGDLGHLLDEDTLREIGRVDLLLVPVGGIFTLDGRGANEVVETIDPRVVIPMHFKTDALSFDLEPVDRFVNDRDFEGPEKSLSLYPEDLVADRTRFVLLDYRW